NPSSMSATGNWTWTAYTVTNTSTSAFNIALHAGSSGASNQADVYMDGALVGTITIPNTGSNTTMQNSATVTTASLPAGTHGLLIKAKAGTFGFDTILMTTATTPT